MMEMKVRISEIMKYYQLSPTEFAKRLDMNASILSHIMSGRNKASLDVILRILTAFEEINPDWLLFDRMPMIKEGASHPAAVLPLLESKPAPQETISNTVSEVELKPEVVEKPLTPRSVVVQEPPQPDSLPQIVMQEEKKTPTPEPAPSILAALPIKSKEKAISRITVFYNDKTYQTFVEEEE